MNRLSNLLNRTSVARSDSPSASPGHDAAKPAPLVRNKAARDLSMPAPIGKRGKAKRILSAAFSMNASPTAVEGPVRRNAKPATSTQARSQQAASPENRSPATAERMKAMMEPKDVRSSSTADLPHTE